MSLAFTYGAPNHTYTRLCNTLAVLTHAASPLHVRLRRPLPGLRAERRQRQHLLPRQRLLARAAAPFLWSSPGRIIAPSSRAVAFCGSYPRRVWAPFYSAGGSGGVRARSPAAIRAIAHNRRSHAPRAVLGPVGGSGLAARAVTAPASQPMPAPCVGDGGTRGGVCWAGL